ncbi:MAG: hypothetical protein AMXMBFR44_5090 [Candidatus Campbellbacteria bacterium]
MTPPDLFEEILVYKGPEFQTYTINLLTGNASSSADKRKEILTFSGLPEQGSTNDTVVEVARILFSHDLKEALVSFNISDRTQPRSGFDGSYPVLDTRGFRCALFERTCLPSAILGEANVAEKDVEWFAWNRSKGTLFGHPAGEGFGMSSPVVVYDYENGASRKTSGFDVLKNEKRATVPAGAFSPSLQTFVMVDDKELLLYDSADLSRPVRAFDLHDVFVENSTNISSVAWSPDEITLAIGTDTRIYILDLRTGLLTLRFNDTTQGKGGLYWDRNHIQFSPGGRLVLFVDYEGFNQNGSNTEDILRDINVKTGEVREILRDSSIGLIDPWR